MGFCNVIIEPSAKFSPSDNSISQLGPSLYIVNKGENQNQKNIQHNITITVGSF